MPGFDDRLVQELDRAARPAPATPEIFHEIDRRRARRHLLRKVQSAVLAAVVLAGTGAGVLALNHAFRPNGARVGHSGPSPTASGVVAAAPRALDVKHLAGVTFPVCNVTAVTADFLGDGTPDTVYVFTEKRNDVGPCPSLADGQTVIGFASNGTTVTNDFGPYVCPGVCSVFAAPDIEHDRHAELAIATTEEASTELFRLYRLTVDPSLALQPFRINKPGDPADGFNPGPATFAWGGSVQHLAGVDCDAAEGLFDLTPWMATRIADGSRYHVRFVALEIHGTRLVFRNAFDSTVLANDLMFSRRDLCHSPVIASQ